MLSFLVPIVEVFQVVIATLASVFFFVIAGITFGASLVGLALSTPLFLIFSPILVPATITTTLLTGAITGVAALSVTAMTLLRWLLKDRMGVKEKNNPAPKGAPTKADKPSVNPEGDTPEGMGGEQQGGGMAGDQQGGGMGGDQSGGGMAGDQQGGGMGGGQPGGGMGGGQPGGGMGGDKPKGKKGGKPDEMGGDKPKEKKGKKSKGKKGDKPK